VEATEHQLQLLPDVHVSVAFHLIGAFESSGHPLRRRGPVEQVGNISRADVAGVKAMAVGAMMRQDEIEKGCTILHQLLITIGVDCAGGRDPTINTGG
jgi:hypothetical protein